MALLLSWLLVVHVLLHGFFLLLCIFFWCHLVGRQYLASNEVDAERRNLFFFFSRPARGNASKARCRIAKTMLVEENIDGADDVVQVGLSEDPEHAELKSLQVSKQNEMLYG